MQGRHASIKGGLPRRDADGACEEHPRGYQEEEGAHSGSQHVPVSSVPGPALSNGNIAVTLTEPPDQWG